MNIRGNNILIRALELDDMECLLDIINDEEFEFMSGSWSFPISKYQQMKWFEKNSISDDVIKLAIENENGELIGIVDLRDIDWKNRSLKQGLKILKNYRNRNYGEDTLKTIMKYVFEELQFNRMSTSILESNTASKKLYIEKCKWTIEGMYRQTIFKRNKYHNEVMVSILKKEYIETYVNKKLYL